MGMRAGIIIADGDKVQDYMTLQWATYTDNILGHFATTVNNEDFVDNIRLLCAEGCHASCFVLNEDKSLAVERVDPDFYDLPNSIKSAVEDHLNSGSIGVMVDIQDKDYVTFFYYGHNGNVDRNKVAIDDLRKFYQDAENDEKFFLDRETIWS